MDLRKIGKFIAELRREQGLTQEQFGEKIGVTNKTISRWETGTYLPPADALLAMSKLFSVSINEILSGKRLSEGEYKEAAEENLKQTIKTGNFTLQDRVDFYKKKWLKEHIAWMIFMGIIVISVFAVGAFENQPFVIAVSVILFVIVHCIRNNNMMSYIEKNAFDGTGK